MEWARWQNERPETMCCEHCPIFEDITKMSIEKLAIAYWLCFFVQEVKRKDGSLYQIDWIWMDVRWSQQVYLLYLSQFMFFFCSHFAMIFEDTCVCFRPCSPFCVLILCLLGDLWRGVSSDSQ